MKNLLSATINFLYKLKLHLDVNNLNFFDEDDKKDLALCIKRIQEIHKEEQSKQPLLSKMSKQISDYYYDILHAHWDQSYANPCTESNTYHPHKVLMYAPFLHYGDDENRYLILGEIRCQGCDNYFLGIFTFVIDNDNLYAEEGRYNYGCLGWVEFEFPISAEGYLRALKTFNELISESLINYWISEGKEPSYYRKHPRHRDPSMINFFGVVTEKIPYVDDFRDENSIFKNWGTRTGDQEAPHKSFPEQKG